MKTKHDVVLAEKGSKQCADEIGSVSRTFRRGEAGDPAQVVDQIAKAMLELWKAEHIAMSKGHHAVVDSLRHD